MNCVSIIFAIRRSNLKRSSRTIWIGASKTAPRTGPSATISRRSTPERVLREEFPVRNLGLMQAFAFNIRRDKFKDSRLRRAFNFALDFEKLNSAFLYGQYKRISSYFEGTELASSGLPQGMELEMLKALRDK